jgi:hypothetical protein
LGLRTLLKNQLQIEYKLGTVSATYITGDFEITGDFPPSTRDGDGGFIIGDFKSQVISIFTVISRKITGDFCYLLLLENTIVSANHR